MSRFWIRDAQPVPGHGLPIATTGTLKIDFFNLVYVYVCFT